VSEPLSQSLSFLPHGPEFRFLDRLLLLEPGRTGRGEYTLRGHEPFLAGHFPAQPLLPGVLLIEAAAQLAGVVAQSDPTIPPLPGLKLTAVRAKIMGTARPGESVQLEAQVTARLGRLVQAQTKATVDGRIVLQAELTLSGDAAGP
jgi:3-hydroxyacyl-[acyl-carrier-protein] dehydratase